MTELYRDESDVVTGEAEEEEMGPLYYDHDMARPELNEELFVPPPPPIEVEHDEAE